MIERRKQPPAEIWENPQVNRRGLLAVDRPRAPNLGDTDRQDALGLDVALDTSFDSWLRSDHAHNARR